MGGGHISTKDSSIKVDLIKKSKDFYIHKQIERRDGLLFMRLKKRAFHNYA